jgi:TonB family protein
VVGAWTWWQLGARRRSSFSHLTGCAGPTEAVSLGAMNAAARSFLCAAAVGIGLVAKAAPAAELVIEWAPLSGTVESYEVERRVEDAGEEFKPIARLDGDTTRFTDRGVVAGVQYCYRVRGVRGERRSPPSPPLCNVASEPPPAAAPAVLSEPAAPPPPEPSGEFREVKALRRPPPKYPLKAQLEGVSGWVKLIFTVTAAGSTRDIRVTAADPPGVFEEAAIEAAERFVYTPRLENGVAVDRPNVETEITFTWINRGGTLTSERR